MCTCIFCMCIYVSTWKKPRGKRTQNNSISSPHDSLKHLCHLSVVKRQALMDNNMFMANVYHVCTQDKVLRMLLIVHRSFRIPLPLKFKMADSTKRAEMIGHYMPQCHQILKETCNNTEFQEISDRSFITCQDEHKDPRNI